MITLITYLTWPKHIEFHGLSLETISQIERYIHGPNYYLTAWIDFVIIAIIGGIIIFRKTKNSESSSKTEP